MKIIVERFLFDREYTMSRVYIDDKFYCFGIEPYDASITKETPVEDIKALKEKHGKIAVGLGEYELIYNWSNKYQKMLPLVKDTPGFSGVRLHSGNTSADTRACLCLGKFYKNGVVSDSRATMNKFISYWKELKFEKATIEYKYGPHKVYNY